MVAIFRIGFVEGSHETTHEGPKGTPVSREERLVRKQSIIFDRSADIGPTLAPYWPRIGPTWAPHGTHTGPQPPLPTWDPHRTTWAPHGVVKHGETW